MERLDQKEHSGHVWLGFFLLLIGGALFLDRTNLPIPHWVVSWETLLIAIGLFVGIKNRFQNATGFILMLIGGIFLINDIFPALQWHHYAWPLVLIIAGLYFIFRPQKNHSKWRDWNRGVNTTIESDKVSNDEVFDYTTFFGSLQKNILTKDFKGGDAVTVFGGTELNFIHADINGTVVLDLTQIFGGTKLIIPSHWQVKSELTSIFAGIEDKRPVQPVAANDKLLLLKGTSIFGGIEIVSY